MADSLYLEIADFVHMVHTGIYSEETGRPQPLRFTVRVKLKAMPHYDPDTSLDASKNYMDLKFACSEATTCCRRSCTRSESQSLARLVASNFASSWETR